MPNNSSQFINAYKSARALGNEIVPAISGALNDLNKLKLQENTQGSKQQNQFFSVSGNTFVVANVLKQLAKLPAKNPSIQTIVHILELSLVKSKGLVKELLEYIVNDIKPMVYNTRSSDLVQVNSESHLHKEQWAISLAELLDRKNLKLRMFEGGKIKFGDHIDNHVQWIFQNIYSVPYVYVSQQHDKNIARYHHGIQHASRVAYYIPVLANLYRKHGDKAALDLTAEDIKLLQIAALFHDAAREDEEEDRWDHESALLLYYYLTKILNFDKNKAKLIAEAIANKDPHEEGFFILAEKSDGEASWTIEKTTRPKKNIYQKIIHDADCLDIIRARDHFEAEYLDFYRDIACLEVNKLAMEEMACLITEARSLIELQGDSRNRTKSQTKELYEHEDSYRIICADIDPKKHKIMYALYADSCLLSAQQLNNTMLVDTASYNPTLGLTEKNLQAAAREGKLFARGIPMPSALSKKPLKSGSQETVAALELRKTGRKKSDRTTKEGNPFRSICMFGYGSAPFSNAGFLIIEPNVNDISQISYVDVGTGYGKKHHLKHENILTRDEKIQQLKNLLEKQKKGGSSTTFSGSDYAWSHVEIIYHLRNYQAIYFTQDPSICNNSIYDSPEVFHPHAPLLEAIFLQNEYKKVYGQELPIFEYSGIHNQIKHISQIDKEDIKRMWVEMCIDYMRSALADPMNDNVFTLSVEQLKVVSMYKRLNGNYVYTNDSGPADSNYDEGFRKIISEAIENKRKKIISEHRKSVENKLHQLDFSLLPDEIFFQLLRDSVIANASKSRIEKAIQSMLNESKPKSESKPKYDSDSDSDSESYSVPIPEPELFERGLPEVEPIMWSYTQAAPLVEFFSNEIFNPLPTNKTNHPQEILNNKKTFYQLDIIRMYALAKEVGLTSYVHEIQAKAHKHTDNCIDKIESILNNGKLLNKDADVGKIFVEDIAKQLKYLVNLSYTFDLLPSLRQKIKEITLVTLQQISQNIKLHENKSLSLVNYFYIVDHLNRNELVEPEYRKIIKQDIEHWANMDTSSKYYNQAINETFLLFYLMLVKISEISNLDCKKTLLHLFNNKNIMYDFNDTAFFAVINASPLLNDLEVFRAIVGHVNLRAYPRYRYEDDTLRNYRYFLRMLKEIMPNKNFSEDQLNIIKEEFNKDCHAVLDYLLSRTSNTEEKFDRLINIIDLYMSSDLIIHLKDMPYVKEQFIEILSQLTDAEKTKFSSKILKFKKEMGLEIEMEEGEKPLQEFKNTM